MTVSLLTINYQYTYFTHPLLRLEKIDVEKVYCNIVISQPNLEPLKTFVISSGGQISVEKPLKFENLGFLKVEDQENSFKCLVCSKILKWKHNVITHLKNLHGNQKDLKIPCPRNIHK